MTRSARYRFFPILILLWLVTLPEGALAVPANPAPHLLKQADGLTFKARQWGDELQHGWETLRGSTIVFDRGLRSWTYALLGSDKQLTSSSRIVGKDAPPAGLVRHLRPAFKGDRRNYYKMTREARAGGAASGAWAHGSYVVPPTGTGNVPVILINYSDTTTTYTAADFNTLLFSNGTNSMRDYYKEVSYNQFTVSSGPGGVAGWYTAANTRSYYGGNNALGYDRRPGFLVREAISSADAAGFNFAPYDQDGDCYVDAINIVHQGSDEASSGFADDIWSHRWNLNDAFDSGYSDGGEWQTNDNCPAGGKIKINDYVIEAERKSTGEQETIGVFAHEYAHALGLPDLYDTDYSSWGLGYWSLMAFGNYNQVALAGDRPAHIDPWGKWKLGWLLPKPVGAGLYAEQITQAATAADVYRLRQGTPTTGEYFLVENRQKTGFDAGLPGSGLLIWHVDAPKMVGTWKPNNNECYPGGPDCAVQHYGIRLVQADNLYDLEQKNNKGDARDPYPGSLNKLTFSPSTFPNSNLFNGTASLVALANISPSGANMTVTMTTTAPAAPQSLTPVAYSTSQIMLTWKDMANNEASFWIQRKTGTCASGNPWSSVANVARNLKNWGDSGRAANTFYAYRIYAVNASGKSQYSGCSYAKTGPAGSPNSPTNVVAESQGGESIKVRWTDASYNETKFRIYKKAGTNGSWVTLGDVGAGVTSYTDPIAPGNTSTTTYYYMVVACNTYCSPYSNQAIVPYSQANLAANSAVHNQVSLSWTDRATNESGNYIYRKTGNCGSLTPWTYKGSTGPNAGNYIDTTAVAGNIYSYKVQAIYTSYALPNAFGKSWWSNCVSITAK